MNSLQDQLDNVLNVAREYTINIERYAKEHAADTPDDVERELKLRLQNFKIRVNDQISALEQSVLRQTPKENEPNYEERKRQYMEFLSGVTTGLSKLTDMMKGFFKSLADAICQIVQWIVEKLPTIIPCIVTLFEKIIFPLLDRKYNVKT